MHPVPHATFSAPPDVSGVSRPPGAALAEKLEVGLRGQLAGVRGRENWRDCGWSLGLNCGGLELQVYFAPYRPEDIWLLAVAPLNQPGIIARMLGRKAIPAGEHLERVAGAVHRVLTGIAGVKEVRWMFGGPPEKVVSVATPQELAWDAAL